MNSILENRAETALASLSILSAAGLALKFRGSIPVPIVILLTGFIAYPCYGVLNTDGGSYDILFLTLGFASFGGVLAFSSAFPVGYADVHKHIFASQVLIENGEVEFLSNITTGFVGLYVLVDILSNVNGTSISSIARIFPLLTYLASILIFYTLLARKMLSARAALFATIIFATNWGVYRFSVEFRTINLAFPLVLLLVAVLFKLYLNPNQRFSLVFFLVGTAAVISHFTTYVFFLVVVLTMLFWRLAKNGTDNNITILILFSSIIFVIYTIFINHSFTGAIRFTWIQLQNTIISPTPGGPNTRGVVGMNYGFTLFVMRWIVRLLFVIFFCVFTVKILRNRKKYQIDLWSISIVLGGIFFIASVIGFALNPSRIFIYFAIPYAITYAIGGYSLLSRQYHERWYENRTVNAQSIATVLIIVIVISSVFIVPLKFPQYIIGDPSPIRNEQPIDDKMVLKIDEQDISSREYTTKIKDKSQISFVAPFHSGALRIFYNGLQVRNDRNMNGKYTVTYSAMNSDKPEIGTLYNNGKIEIQLCVTKSCRIYTET